MKDFTPIILVATAPLVLVANPALPVNNVKELTAYAKAHLGQKGLESDVAVILDPAPMGRKHLYVALTRGAKRLVVCSDQPILTPAP